MPKQLNMRWEHALPNGGAVYLAVAGTFEVDDLQDLRDLSALVIRTLERSLKPDKDPSCPKKSDS